jgi:hypothetical protein
METATVSAIAVVDRSDISPPAIIDLVIFPPPLGVRPTEFYHRMAPPWDGAVQVAAAATDVSM